MGVPFRAGEFEVGIYTLSLFPHSSISFVAPGKVNMDILLV